MTRTVTLPAKPKPLTVSPDDTALIVVDMQNGYCSKGGYIDIEGLSVDGAPAVIQEVKAVVDACRAAGIPIIYLQNGFHPDQREVGGPSAPVYHKSNALRLMRERPELAGTLITYGTWDYAIVDELTPEPGDIIVPKSRYSGFAGTNLEQQLHARRIRNVLVCGVATNVCVESTIRDAYHREFFPIMVTDATMPAGPGQQEATEFNVLRFFGWLTTGAELRAALKSNE